MSSFTEILIFLRFPNLLVFAESRLDLIMFSSTPRDTKVLFMYCFISLLRFLQNSKVYLNFDRISNTIAFFCAPVTGKFAALLRDNLNICMKWSLKLLSSFVSEAWWKLSRNRFQNSSQQWYCLLLLPVSQEGGLMKCSALFEHQIYHYCCFRLAVCGHHKLWTISVNLYNGSTLSTWDALKFPLMKTWAAEFYG